MRLAQQTCGSKQSFLHHFHFCRSLQSYRSFFGWNLDLPQMYFVLCTSHLPVCTFKTYIRLNAYNNLHNLIQQSRSWEAKLAKILHSFYGINYVFTPSRNWPLTGVRWTQSTSTPFLPWGFMTKILYAFLISFVLTTYPTQLILRTVLYQLNHFCE